MRKGVLITFEGSDGSGKSTQIKLLQKALKKKNHNVFVTREPGGTPLGEKIRSLILFNKMSAMTELLLFQASRAELVSKEFLPRLKKKQIILCDRYEESSIVFQGVARNLSVSTVKAANKLATQGIRADLIILLDAKAKTTKKRMSGRAKLDRFEKEKTGFHQKIQAAYRRLARKDRRFKVYDSNLDRQSIHKMVLKDVEKLLKRK